MDETMSQYSYTGLNICSHRTKIYVITVMVFKVQFLLLFPFSLTILTFAFWTFYKKYH